MLRHPQVQDSGKYVCVITNTVGEEKVETTLTVSAPLSAHVEPQQQIIDVGKSASFHCVISGHPVTSVSWFRNGRPLPLDGDTTAIFPSKEMLVLQAVQREDRGMYQCFAQNDDETAQAAAELKLGGKIP
uniref:Ig-like domain-containing protein n=1 Tax=Strigamia maritima TaxID=126957 RepID=T1JKH9_STRMM